MDDLGRPLVVPRAPSAQTASSAGAIHRVYGLFKDTAHKIDAYSRLRDRVVFDDRRRGSRILVCMLAGYKPELWPYVLPRFQRALPEVDVCLISPGLSSVEIGVGVVPAGGADLVRQPTTSPSRRMSATGCMTKQN